MVSQENDTMFTVFNQHTPYYNL